MPALRWLGVTGLAPFPGVVLLAQDLPLGDARTRLLQHERIHHRQQLECLIVPFYMLYAGMYVWQRLRGHGHWGAYERIPFEREAYAHEGETAYLRHRPWYAWARS